jgi:hypothetical protein
LKALLLTTLVLCYWLLHQDFWFWRSSRPLLFGFLPPALSYHAAYSLGASLLMWLLVKTVWPSHLEEAEPVEEKHPE